MESLEAVFSWLLRASWQASVLVGLVLLTQWFFRKKLSPGWRYALWLLVLARLLMPASPQSPVSLFNLTRFNSPGLLAASRSLSSAPTPAPASSAAAVAPAGDSGAPRAGTAATQSAAITRRPPPETGGKATSAAAITLRTSLLFIWLAGVCWLALRMVWQNARFARRVLRRRQVTDSAALEALEDCRQSMGLRTPLTVIETSEVKSPALYGFIRPRLVLPQGTLAAFSREELYYIFLHELAHVKRCDMAVNWLISGLRALHWFNPILWFGFRRMAADREVAADAIALAHAPGGGRQLYGQTIIKLLESFTRPTALPGLVGILEDSQQMKRRITMIAQFKQMTRWSTAAAGLLLVLGAITLTDAQSDPTFAKPTTPAMTVRRVLADAINVGDNLTAHGKLIRGLKAATGDVVQFDVGTGQQSRIKNTGPWGEQDMASSFQVFSRDGEQIAYDSSSKDGIPQFQVRNLDGSNVRTLYSEKGTFIRALDWSPDAGSILASRSGQEMLELILLSTADGSVRVLKSIPKLWLWLHGASFSPDGRYIAYSHKREGSPLHGDIFLMTAEGRDEVVVAGHPAEDRLEGWSPDGSRLIFSSDRSGRWDLWAIAIAEGKPQGKPTLLKKDFGSGSEVLGFTLDGSCYYATGTRLGGLYRGEIDLATGKILVPPVSVTLRYTGLPAKPSWSPNGARLQYVSNRDAIGPGNNILTIRTADMRGERFLSPRLHFLNQVSWGPDGRSLVAIGRSDTGGGIFRIDAETSEVTQLAGESRYSPNLCPDGKTLVFVRAGLIITRRNLDTGAESNVIKATNMQYDLSPDGRDVVFQVDGAVKIVPLNGGEPRELCRGLAKSYRLSWTRDGRYIIVQSWGGGNKNEIWYVPAQGGTPLKLELFVPKMSSFALHPDNRRFVYSVEEESKSELWVLENFLPTEKLAAK